MEVITIDWTYLIIALVVGLALGGAIAIAYFRSGLSRERQQLEKTKRETEQECEDILSEAQKSAESRKRELLLQAKEEIHKSKIKLERDTKERKEALLKERSRLEQKEENLDRRQGQQAAEAEQLRLRGEELARRETSLQDLEKERLAALEKVSMLSVEEARRMILESATETYRHEAAQRLMRIEDETKEEAERLAKNLIVSAVQRYASDYVSEITVSVVNLPNDEMKGRIIGREGRNIRTFETISGVDLIIDDTPEAVVLSCFDPIRRETARLALERLLQDGRIHPTRIEEMLEKSAREIKQTMKREGDRVALETGVMGLSPELIQLLGRMKYRTSYGQNVLQHSVEVCWIAGMMAAELGLDVALAKRAGLLHDIGKALDFEMEGTHVELGVEVARKNKEHPVVINAIASHHGDVEADHPISVLVAAADALSAARPGARRENLETYIKRLQKLEEIAMSFDGVERSYAIQAGREIRVIVRPEDVSDEEMMLKAREISKRIESELNYPGQIKVNLIRESRAVEYAR